MTDGEKLDDVTALRNMIDSFNKNPGDVFSRRVVRELADAAWRVADLVAIRQAEAAEAAEWQAAANRWAEQVERARGSQASVDQLAASVWGVREGRSLARDLLTQYDIYPKREADHG